jgi:hypothetical protein
MRRKIATALLGLSGLVGSTVVTMMWPQIAPAYGFSILAACGVAVTVAGALLLPDAITWFRSWWGPSAETSGPADMTIHEVFFHLCPDVLDNPKELRWEKVGDELRDKLSTEQLVAWGREIDPDTKRVSALVDIPATYWPYAQFVYFFLQADRARDDPHSWTPRNRPTRNDYADIRFSRAQILRIWPQRLNPPKAALPTWYELEQRFKELEPALQFSRIDGQTGAAGEYWRIAGGPRRDFEDRFEALASIASTRLFQDFPGEIEKHDGLASEANPVIRWYKALQCIGNRYGNVRVLEQRNDDGSSGGFIYSGTIDKPAAASATLCLKLASASYS